MPRSLPLVLRLQRLPCRHFGRGNCRKRRERFTIDWADLKEAILEALSGNFARFSSGNNQRTAAGVVEENVSFKGYRLIQAKDWLENGYEDAALHIDDFAPPIREKRRFVYADEGMKLIFRPLGWAKTISWDRGLSGRQFRASLWNSSLALFRPRLPRQ